MAKKPKTISYEYGLKARALFSMGADHYKQASRYEAALHDLLKLEDTKPYCGHLSDAMVDGDTGFEGALENAGFIIAAPKRGRKSK